MRKFSLNIGNNIDIAEALSVALRNIPSLSASRENWAILLYTMGIRGYESENFRRYEEMFVHTVITAARNITEDAVNAIEGGSVGFHKAFICACDTSVIEFGTDNGTYVIISPTLDIKGKNGISLTVDFNRDNRYLSVIMLADLFRYAPSVVAPVLAVAIKETCRKLSAA